MTKTWFFTVVITLLATTSSAQDVQLRVPVHIQTKSDGLGLAGWAVLPNTMVRGNNTATLLVAGLVWKSKANWLEVMGGTHRSQNGYIDPLINIRFQKNPTSQLGISGELQQTFRASRRRTLWWFVLDTPTPRLKMRVGVEVENINFWNGRAIYGLGPRVSMPVPLTLPLGGKLTLVATQQIKTGRDFTRLYIVVNYKH